MLTSMSCTDLLLTMALATTPQTLQQCRFDENADLSDARFGSVLSYYPACFSFSEERRQWHIKPARRMTFSHCDFSGTQFSGWDLAHVEFSYCRFDGASFDACTLRDATFRDCFFYNAQFMETVRMEEVRFHTCTLTNTFLLASWEQCCFTNCSLVGCKASQAAFRDGEFSGGYLTGDFSGCDFAETTFNGVDMRGADLTDADFAQANFDDERFLIGHVLAEHAFLGEVGRQEAILRQMAARYVQQCYGSCWRGFIEAFASYPGLLAWAYRVLSTYPCLKGKLRYYKSHAPQSEVELMEHGEQISQVESAE
ncbi:pentapeptide repeat-containing protein [Ktedonospora formicarum]|nr:pentapeptide repeat-containing protein [Ktedonospora formicarum]